MRVRGFFATIILAFCIASANAQEAKKTESAQSREVAPTAAQQRPIVSLLRERELLNAQIEGALKALMAFLDLSPSEWDCVQRAEGITFVRRKPAVSDPSPKEKEKQ